MHNSKTDIGAFRVDGPGGPPDGPFVASVPGSAAPLLPVDLPDALKHHARENVARRQIGDQLGQDTQLTEIRPFATAKKHTDWDRVLLVDAEQLQTWKRKLSKYGKRCQAILPDYLLLPASAETWTVEVVDGQVSARLGIGDGFSAEPELALVMLRRGFNEHKPKAILRLGAEHEAIDEYLQSLNLPVVSTPDALAKQGVLDIQCCGHNELQLDLKRDVQAAYAEAGKNLRSWRWPVLIGLLALAVWTVNETLIIRGLQGSAAAYRLQTSELVREHFVPAGPILDIQAQVTSTLLALQAAGSEAGEKQNGLALFRRAAQVLSKQDAQVLSAAFTVNAGVSVSLNVKTFAELDRVVNVLREAGLAATTSQSSAVDAETVNAVLNIRSQTPTGATE